MTGSISFAKSKARARERRILREHWTLYLSVALLAAVVTTLIAWMFQSQVVPMWTLLPAGLIGAIWAGYPVLFGTYHLHKSDESETWTATELKKLKRAGYRSTGRVRFGNRDVDHVVVGASGVYAVDTKYTDSEIHLNSRRNAWQIERWANSAYDAARGLRLRLKHHCGIDVEVMPVVVVWGSEVAGRRIRWEGVPVIRPSELRECVETGSQCLSPAEQARVLEAAEDMIRIWR